jgi:hypothetical protein
MEFRIQVDTEERYNDLCYSLDGSRFERRCGWDHRTKRGFHAIQVPVKGRARWLRRNTEKLEYWGFTLVKETVDD